MQANCPNCSNRIVIDDAKVPERAFQVKCPKCQMLVRFPGKAAAAEAPPAPAPAATAEPSAAPAAESSDEMRAQMMAQVRREMATTTTAEPNGERALIALSEKSQAGAMTLVLTRLGYQVDTFDDPAEGGRLLEQGVYDVVVTAKIAGSLMKESLYQRMARLGAEARRRVLLVLVGDEFKTGDGTQAWSFQADLVINSRETAAADAVFRSVAGERNRVYQCFTEARKRFEASGS
jgi:predicted Zn finger-like uncharacterized protein